MTTNADNSVTHYIEHDLSLELAGKAGRSAINSYAKKHKQLTGLWTTPYLYNLKVKAPFNTLTGHVEITEGIIVFHIDKVPAMFKVFIGQAVEAIDKVVKQHIAKANQPKTKRGKTL